MRHLLARILLAMAGVLVVALITGFFAGPARGLALGWAGLLCLLACRVGQQAQDYEIASRRFENSPPSASAPPGAY